MKSLLLALHMVLRQSAQRSNVHISSGTLPRRWPGLTRTQVFISPSIVYQYVMPGGVCVHPDIQL